jgi:hypothetical protein
LEYGEIFGINRHPSRPSKLSQTVSTKPAELHFAWMGRAALELGDPQEAQSALLRAVHLEHRGSHHTPAGGMLRSLGMDDQD